MNQKYKEQLMDELVNEKIFIIEGGPFKTSGGLKVPFYIDFKKALSNPVFLEKVSKILLEKLEEENIDYIGGIETTGIPLATNISQLSKKPFFWLRKKLRKHGLNTIIAGRSPKKNSKIAIVDDSVGGGDSIKTTEENLKKEGYNISIFIYIMEGNIMDSAFGRIKKFEKKGIKTFYLCTWKEWVEYLLKKGRISESLARYCFQFIKNPLSFDEEKLNEYKQDLENGRVWIR